MIINALILLLFSQLILICFDKFLAITRFLVSQLLEIDLALVDSRPDLLIVLPLIKIRLKVFEDSIAQFRLIRWVKFELGQKLIAIEVNRAI